MTHKHCREWQRQDLVNKRWTSKNMTTTCVVYLNRSVYNFWLSQRKFKQTSKSGTLQNRFPPTPLSSQFSQENICAMVNRRLGKKGMLSLKWGKLTFSDGASFDSSGFMFAKFSCTKTFRRLQWNIRNYSWRTHFSANQIKLSGPLTSSCEPAAKSVSIISPGLASAVNHSELSIHWNVLNLCNLCNKWRGGPRPNFAVWDWFCHSTALRWAKPFQCSFATGENRTADGRGALG